MVSAQRAHGTHPIYEVIPISVLGGSSAPHPPLKWESPQVGVCPMCTVGRDQFPRSIKLTSSLLLLLLMFNTAVTAMHIWGVSHFSGGWGAEARRRHTHHQNGIKIPFHWWVGGRGAAEADPPLKWDKNPFSAVGPPPPRLRRPPTAEKGFLSHFGGGSASAPHPPLKRETPHIWGVSHVHGGQRPISLEYQINHPPQLI